MQIFVRSVDRVFAVNVDQDASLSELKAAIEEAHLPSLIASLETLPRHSAVIASQDIPLATCFSTCVTMIRVPRKVGLP